MKTLIVQHVPHEGPGFIGRALSGAGARVELCQVFAGDPVPEDAACYAAVVVLGGPMSAYCDAGFPTRAVEIGLLRSALDLGVPVLGVCLGAQLLAMAAGSTVDEGHGWEVGWGTVELTEDAAYDPLLFGLPRQLPVLHWHSDTITLPAGGALLACSDQYEVQAFRVGQRAWGLQFHLEVDLQSVPAFVEGCGKDADTGGVARTSLDEAAERTRAIAQVASTLFDRFCEQIGADALIGADRPQ